MGNDIGEKVSVVIPTSSGRDISRLLASIPQEHQIIVVNSDKLSLAEKRNYGLNLAIYNLVYFVDDDNVLVNGAIDELSQTLKRWHNVGIAGSQAIWEYKIVDGGAYRWLVSGFIWPLFLEDEEVYEVDEVANAFMVHKSVFDTVGKFDSENFPIDLDEADLCLRARRDGWRVVLVPTSRVIHNSILGIRFRRKLNAYNMGHNRIVFQFKHLGALGLFVYLLVFFPLFVLIYVFSLVIHRQTRFIPTFLRGVWDGLRGVRTG